MTSQNRKDPHYPWASSSDEVAVLVVADQCEVKKVYNHHRDDNQENRTNEIDKQPSDERVGQPKPPRLL